MEIKKLKRKIKEQGLYSQFFKGLKQAENLKLVDEYISVVNELTEIGLVNEFLMLINDSKTNKLKGFVGYDTGKLSHVSKWIEDAPKIGCIVYEGCTMNYSEYMKLKHIER
jgi:hypothetical protein